MKKINTFLFSILLLASIISCNKDKGIMSDRDVLQSLYQSTNGKGWYNKTGWGSAEPLSEWYGVEVDSKNRVIKINLRGNNLNGTVPGSIGNLQELKVLDLSDNKLKGTIPNQIRFLKKLSKLKIDHNSFNGMIDKGISELRKKDKGQLISLEVDQKNRFVEKQVLVKKTTNSKKGRGRGKGRKYTYPIQ
ncbi:leucine-rich repeat domain-containing protein [Flammeovirga kamogawensis]|uniref:Leucine-rich repeat domain-containing protein n=1 Tax=Flammeovirga kamogawensis TaxID=373891 RepID=A0ABX8GWP7_9BACT|nr:hypothetical protein [Flammeovirga kamogawensis]MBB6461184.1 hypothetical protein [Flammeovirga kamogawensis]QWG07748.1 hypothetical protein KM029_02065 [Flammeovirga kamogawensis]TRX69554.1 hypothetical protein EO216_16000 [Flammeovirga kamogawensis]